MDSRQKLIEAMETLLWERGYAATSPKDVMQLAGVGQGSMYHHFSGKHELAVEALRVSADKAVGRSVLLQGEGSPLQRMCEYLEIPRDGLKGCRVGRMTQDPQVVADPELLAVVTDAFAGAAKRWGMAIREAIAAGELPAAIEPDDLAQSLAAVLQGGYVLSKARGSQEPMDAAIRGIVTLLRAASTQVHQPRKRELS